MRRILTVEDEKMSRYGIRIMIEGSGVPYREIVECRNGKEAVSLLEREPVDLVLTDIRMPFLDGVGLVSWMQEHLEKDRMPLIIAVSGYSDFEYARSMLRAGAVNYLLKPIDRNELSEALWQAEKMLKTRSIWQEDDGKSGAEKEKLSHVNRKKMEIAIEYVEKNYRRHIDMVEVSNHVDMNYTMFSSMFSQYTGKNFTEYLRRLRLEKAKKLLRGSDLKVREICQAVGFDDISRFSRLFKEETGKTPNAWRNESGTGQAKTERTEKESG